jgi:NAD(P)H-dependent flavin oxidoreductase YrpB (nitropropane dioxygenase family)
MLVLVLVQVPLFVCAVGIPPVWVVEKLHAAGILVMNMAGAPRHVTKALEVGVDIICATGGEGGAHSGDISTVVLLPQCADMCKGRAVLVGGGGLFDGRGIAACFALGAQGVWIGTRFLASPEANANKGWQQAILDASSADTRRIEIYTGRPLRVIKNKLNDEWARKEGEMRELLGQGKIPIAEMMKSGEVNPKTYFGVVNAAASPTDLSPQPPTPPLTAGNTCWLGDRFCLCAGGPLSRHGQGIGKNPTEGFWNDVRTYDG